MENPCPGFQCDACVDASCGPQAYVCSTHGEKVPQNCEGYLVCAQAWWDPYFWTYPVCAEDPCPDFQCLACPAEDPLCRGPWVAYCSEFMVDWHHCMGYLACAQAGWDPYFWTYPVCVVNPCSPGLSACFTCDASCTQASDVPCRPEIGASRGDAGCAGASTSPHVCATRCAPWPGA